MNSASSSATALMALMKLRGVGRRNALRIVNVPPNEPDPERYRDDFMARAEQARIPESELVEAWKRTLEELHKSAAAGVRAFSIHDPDYPPLLRKIPDPPAVLFVKGHSQALLGPKLVAIIGTREPTSYGEKVARKSGKMSAEAGFTVVSGLAHGCDTFGHEGCLDARGVAVAVMAHGLDKVYPAANRDLASRLLDTGGCLVSEYPLGMAASRTAFAERDRIQSGLSHGVLVIETDIKGGTMHTVRFSRDQRRPLACVAHPNKWLGEEKTRGNQQMIADGWATPIPDGAVLLEFLARIAERFEPAQDPPSPPAPVEEPPAQGSWAF
jgi:DNA processing protein